MIFGSFILRLRKFLEKSKSDLFKEPTKMNFVSENYLSEKFYLTRFASNRVYIQKNKNK